MLKTSITLGISVLCFCTNLLNVNSIVNLLPFKIQMLRLKTNKTPAKAFTLPAKMKMGTRPSRAGIGGGVHSLISVLPNEFLFKSVIIRVPSKAF